MLIVVPSCLLNCDSIISDKVFCILLFCKTIGNKAAINKITATVLRDMFVSFFISLVFIICKNNK